MWLSTSITPGRKAMEVNVQKNGAVNAIKNWSFLHQIKNVLDVKAKKIACWWKYHDDELKTDLRVYVADVNGDHRYAGLQCAWVCKRCGRKWGNVWI